MTRSIEFRNKMREIRTGKKHSPETIEKIRQGNIGVKKRSRTEEEKNQQRKKLIEYWSKKTELEIHIHIEKCKRGKNGN